MLLIDPTWRSWILGTRGLEDREIFSSDERGDETGAGLYIHTRNDTHVYVKDRCVSRALKDFPAQIIILAGTDIPSSRTFRSPAAPTGFNRIGMAELRFQDGRDSAVSPSTPSSCSSKVVVDADECIRVISEISGNTPRQEDCNSTQDNPIDSSFLVHTVFFLSFDVSRAGVVAWETSIRRLRTIEENFFAGMVVGHTVISVVVGPAIPSWNQGLVGASPALDVFVLAWRPSIIWLTQHLQYFYAEQIMVEKCPRSEGPSDFPGRDADPIIICS
jgi:hypothetical protein